MSQKNNKRVTEEFAKSHRTQIIFTLLQMSEIWENLTDFESVEHLQKITWHAAEVTSVCAAESFLWGLRRSCFIPGSSSVQGNHRGWLTFISPPEWSWASDRLSQFASSCGTHPIRPGHCASCILALRTKLFSSLSLNSPSLLPSFPPPPPFCFAPQKNAWICVADSESPALALSGSFWLDAKPIILISLFCALEWPQTKQISSRTY